MRKPKSMFTQMTLLRKQEPLCTNKNQSCSVFMPFYVVPGQGRKKAAFRVFHGRTYSQLGRFSSLCFGNCEEGAAEDGKGEVVFLS